MQRRHTSHALSSKLPELKKVGHKENKEKLDKHKDKIKKLKEMIKGLSGGTVVSGGPGVDMNELKEKFALKKDLEEAEKSISNLEGDVKKALDGNS